MRAILIFSILALSGCEFTEGKGTPPLQPMDVQTVDAGGAVCFVYAAKGGISCLPKMAQARTGISK
jgi:hypothetical protein